MSRTIGRLRYFRLAYFSKPESNRSLFRAIRRNRLRTILEIGIGVGQRALDMIRVAQIGRHDAPVSYAGIDLFEARTSADPPGVTVKQAHQLLKPTTARVQLIPGDPYSALARVANRLGQLDLIVVSCDQPSETLTQAWFYVPRLLHAGTQVWREQRDPETNGLVFEQLDRSTIEAWAQAARRRSVA